MKDSMWDRFEVKKAISYTGYKETRLPALAKELARVGLEAEVAFGLDDPFDALAFRTVRHAGNMRLGTHSCTMAHYRAVKTAYENGARSIFVVEDDVRFLKDTEKLMECVESLPSDYDLAKFEWFFGRKQTQDERASIMGRDRIGTWIDGRGVLSVGAACYAMSRNGMKWIIDLVEDAARRPGKGKLRVIDMYHRPWPSDGIKMYLAAPVAAVQAENAVTINETSKDYSMVWLGREKYSDDLILESAGRRPAVGAGGELGVWRPDVGAGGELGGRRPDVGAGGELGGRRPADGAGGELGGRVTVVGDF